MINADLHCHSTVSDGTLSPEDLAARAKANGVELVKPVKRGNDRSWQAWIEDPAGNLIELQEYTPESKQQVAL